ncbi:hypothetical protein [Hymenobacter siberiensis]|uniref:hypothetical protein n=1 Tax=Hymenobacter siberiensis TaxID=2848396 RepID=UPI001C1E6A83|nr:hypothetical protein [Hymenobacter siberiensis]
MEHHHHPNFRSLSFLEKCKKLHDCQALASQMRSTMVVDAGIDAAKHPEHAAAIFEYALKWCEALSPIMHYYTCDFKVTTAPIAEALVEAFCAVDAFRKYYRRFSIDNPPSFKEHNLAIWRDRNDAFAADEANLKAIRYKRREHREAIAAAFEQEAEQAVAKQPDTTVKGIAAAITKATPTKRSFHYKRK